MIVLGAILTVWLAVPSSEPPANYPTTAPRPTLMLAAPLEPPSALTHDPSLMESRGDRSDGEDGATQMDLFGNTIMSAVATYKVDNAGSVYELHSPHTEVPRLGVPKS